MKQTECIHAKGQLTGWSLFHINLLVRFAGAFSFDGERMTIDTALHKPRHPHGIG